MAAVGEFIPVILIPRFTSYVGITEMKSVPLDVSAYYRAYLTLWRGPLLGSGSPTFAMYPEFSHDTVTWVAASGSPFDPGNDAAVNLDISPLPRRWMRVRIVLTGTDPAVTGWCAGMFEARIPD